MECEQVEKIEADTRQDQDGEGNGENVAGEKPPWRKGEREDTTVKDHGVEP